MTLMKFIKKVPASLLGVGGPYQPGQEYPLPDGIAAGLIATKDPDWEQVKAKKNQPEGDASSSKEGLQDKRRKS